MQQPGAHVRSEYVPEFGRVVRIREIDRPMRSDDEETAQTITFMDDLAAKAAKRGAVIDATNEALEYAGLDRDADPLEIACAVYWFLKRTIRYVPTPGTSPFVDQTLIEPCAVLAMPEPIGDCPQFSMLANAMLRTCCIDSLFVTIKAEPQEPDLWSHVYNTVEIAPGVWLPFDASNGPEPGAEYARPFAKKIWPRLSPAACRQGRGAGAMTHTFRRTPGMRNRNLRTGLGDVSCDADGNCYDSSSGVYTPAPVYSPVDLYSDAGITSTATAYGTPAPATAASSGSGISSLLSQLVSSAAQVAAPAVKAATTPAPYFITNPTTGQSVLYNPSTGATAGATTLSSLTASGGSGLLLVGALGLVLVLAMSHK